MSPRWWRRGRADDRGSLPVAVLLITIGMGLSGLLATTVTAQIKATRATVHSAEALDAAQSGLDIALSRIRLATVATAPGTSASCPAARSAARSTAAPTRPTR